jgi:hypothetical protein
MILMLVFLLETGFIMCDFDSGQARGEGERRAARVPLPPARPAAERPPTQHGSLQELCRVCSAAGHCCRPVRQLNQVQAAMTLKRNNISRWSAHRFDNVDYIQVMLYSVYVLEIVELESNCIFEEILLNLLSNLSIAGKLKL